MERRKQERKAPDRERISTVPKRVRDKTKMRYSTVVLFSSNNWNIVSHNYYSLFACCRKIITKEKKQEIKGEKRKDKKINKEKI